MYKSEVYKCNINVCKSLSRIIIICLIGSIDIGLIVNSLQLLFLLLQLLLMLHVWSDSPGGRI
jgi:hypothetical protein